MPKINVYVNEREKAWAKCRPGYVRELIQMDMYEKEGLYEALNERGEAIEAGRMIDETLLKLEGVEVDNLEGRDFQEEVIGHTKGGHRKT
jgi:hypothetical protein